MPVATTATTYSHVDSRSQKLVHLLWCGGMQERNRESLGQEGADCLVKRIEKQEIPKRMVSFLHTKLGLSKWCKEINQGAVHCMLWNGSPSAQLLWSEKVITSWPDPKLVHNLNSHLQEGLVSVLAHQFQMYLDQLVGMQPGTSEDLLVESIVLCCRTYCTEASAALILPFLARLSTEINRICHNFQPSFGGANWREPEGWSCIPL